MAQMVLFNKKGTLLPMAVFNINQTIEELWRMAKLAAHQYLFEKDLSFVRDTAIHAFKK